MQVPLLYLLNEIADISTNRLVLNLVQGLDKKRYTIHVGSTKTVANHFAGQLQSAGAKVVHFGNLGQPKLKIVLNLVQYIQNNAIHIVHTHHLRADLLGGLAARWARCPLLVSTKHTMNFIPGQERWLLRNLFYWPAMYIPDRVITVSEGLRNQVISRLHMSPDRVHTIHSGINVDKFNRPKARESLRQNFGFEPDDFVVGYVGRLVEGKGLECLLNAAHQVLAQQPKISFLIVGDGPLKDTIELMSYELGIASKVIFTGYRTDIPEILAVTDVFVLPSLTEGLPLSLMEAMAAGKPVIVTDVGGVEELVFSGRTGILISPDSVSDIKSAILDLFDHPEKRNNISQAGQSDIIQNYSVQRMVDDYQNFYEAMAR